MIYQSTKALSVYNALSLTGKDMSREQVDTFLRSAGVHETEGYVDAGTEYLLEKQFVTEVAGVLVIERLPSRRGRPLVRSVDRTELLWGDA